jgi:hypothetical protein
MDYNLLELVRKTPGAVSMTELFGLFDTVVNNLQCPMGVAVDLGSNAGKSSFVGSAALSAIFRTDTFHLVDPVYDLTNEEEWKNTFQKTVDNLPWGYCKEKNFKKDLLRKLKKVSKLEHVLYGVTSLTYLKESRNYSYVFIDSDDHQLDLLHQETRMLLEKVMVGGLIFFHDFMGNYVAPGMTADYMVGTGLYEYVDIDWQKAINFVNKYDLEKDNNTWHFKDMANPNFLGCIKRVK